MQYPLLETGRCDQTFLGIENGELMKPANRYRIVDDLLPKAVQMSVDVRNIANRIGFTALAAEGLDCRQPEVLPACDRRNEVACSFHG